MNLVYSSRRNRTSRISFLPQFTFVNIDEFQKLVSSTVIEYIENFVNINADSTKTMETSTPFNILSMRDGSIETFVNIRKINDIRYLNKFFEAVNSKLPEEGLFIGCAETKNLRKERVLNKYPKLISYPYYALDFFVKRVLPKWKTTRKLYFFLTRGNNRVLALPEILGRLVSCGFEIVDYRKIDKFLYFVVKKVKEPLYDKNPTYGPLIRLKRVGKNGKIIHVFKMRTMHPYAEYLQEYIYKQNSLQEGGKFKDDFRITNWGKIFRKLWIDELPMIVNWIKRDLKLVGVRPISRQYLSLYPAEFREKRIKHKPGLIPPFYADLPKTIEEVIASERKYLDEYEKNPIRTDIKYFFKAWYNILVRKARSA